jgi:hypothetical protein
MNHPDLLIERLTQERDEARAALDAAEQAARAAGDDALERAAQRSEELLGEGSEFRDGKLIRYSIASEIRALKSPPSPVAGGPGGAERSGE